MTSGLFRALTCRRVHSKTSLAQVDIGSVAFFSIAANSLDDKRISIALSRNSFFGFGGRRPGCFLRAI